jgi:8-oxo-dGTP pyrophosphatase MutT (NUDIX family)
MGAGSSAKIARRSRHSKRRQQVAAVCYRIRKLGIEFLLVQTRNGRWIFPKGGVELGLTQAQSAALEAFEEAGVHGRIEELPFARYFCQHSSERPDASTDRHSEPAVAVHLCQVSRLEAPQELNRNPTWFSAEKAKQRLLKDRTAEFGAELARVVDRASSRIQRLSSSRNVSKHAARDPLQEVRLEAFEPGRFSADLKTGIIGQHYPEQRRTAQKKIQRSMLRLGPGSTFAEPVHNVTAIDSERRTPNPAKRALMPARKP